MTNEELDEITYQKVKKELNLQEAEEKFRKLNIKVWNEEETDNILKNIAKLVIFLEKEGKIEEVKERFNNSLKQVDDRWILIQ